MTEKIGGYPRPGTDTKPATNQKSGTTERSPGTADGSRAAAAADEVSLTDTVSRLKSIEARIHELPDIDQQRVESLRDLINSGKYEIDAKQIAQRLVQLEQALF